MKPLRVYILLLSLAISFHGFAQTPDFNSLVPGYTEPEDFVSWWKSEIEAMRACPATPSIARAESKDPSVEVFSIEIPMHEGLPVRGYIGIPKNAQPGTLPIYFFAHGAGSVKSDWTKASPDREVLTYARKGAISIDINAHGMLNDAPEEYYAKLDTTDLLMYQERPVRDRETYYFRLMFLRMVRALDYVCTREEWDGKRVLVHGESQGGAQAFALAGLDNRVGAVVAIVPAMTDIGAALQDRKCAWPFQNRPMIPISPRGRAVLPYFDGAIFLKHYHGKLYVEAGLIDKVCDAAGIAAGYNTCPSKEKQISFYPERGHTFITEGYQKDWEDRILSARTRFIDDYLK